MTFELFCTSIKEAISMFPEKRQDIWTYFNTSQGTGPEKSL